MACDAVFAYLFFLHGRVQADIVDDPNSEQLPGTFKAIGKRPETSYFDGEEGLAMTEQDQHLKPEARVLLERALREYGATVFWNMKPSMTCNGLQAAARALRKRGNLAASLLAAEMTDAVNHAAR